MKHTLFITQQCNLSTPLPSSERPISMSMDTARDVVEFIFSHAPKDEPMEIGFFGGEPLLEFELLREITRVIESHQRFDGGYEKPLPSKLAPESPFWTGYSKSLAKDPQILQEMRLPPAEKSCPHWSRG